MFIRTYKFKNGNVKYQCIDDGKLTNKIWKIGMVIQEIWAPNALFNDIAIWKNRHKEN